MFACAQALAAEGVVITKSNIEASDEGYKLDASYSFELTHDLEDALQHGVSLYFKTEIELTRPRWYMWDEKTVTKRQTIRIFYNVITRQYHVAVDGGVQQSFSTLDEALFLIRRPSRWVIAQRSTLKPGDTYNVSLSMDLDRERLSKPIQVNALNNADWRLSSVKKSFTYRAE